MKKKIGALLIGAAMIGGTVAALAQSESSQPSTTTTTTIDYVAEYRAFGIEPGGSLNFAVEVEIPNGLLIDEQKRIIAVYANPKMKTRNPRATVAERLRDPASRFWFQSDIQNDVEKAVFYRDQLRELGIPARIIPLQGR